MGIPVLVMGESGSGKSTSLRNFKLEEIGIMNVASKPLPFRNKLKTIDGISYDKITAILKKNTLKCYAIDDSQFLLAFDMFAKAKETGYGKFTDMAVNFYNLIQTAIKDTDKDTIVYFLHHTDKDENGHLKAKTLGKMLDNTLTVEGLFSIVLLCEADDREHRFITQGGGYCTAKSPMDMFPAEIDNDLKAVDNAIREYYGLSNKFKMEDKNNETN